MSWPVQALVMSVVAGIGFAAGMKVQSWRFDAREKAELEARIQAERAEVQRVAKIAQDIGQALGREVQARVRDRQKWNQEMEVLRHANARIELAQPQPAHPDSISLADAYFSRDTVRLWNNALCIGLPDADCPWRADGASGPTGPASILAAIENHADNAEICNDLRARLRAWQDWARRVGVAR